MDDKQCEMCAYWDDNAGGCPFVDGCQYEPCAMPQKKDPRKTGEEE